MEIELVELRDFLASQAPFDTLPEEILDDLPDHLSVRYVRRGAAFPPPDDEGTYLYIIRSGAIELCDDHGELCEKLGEGDLYSGECQLVDFAAPCEGKACEDSLLYLLPCANLRRLFQHSEPFARHFSDSLRERLKHALTTVQGTGDTDLSLMSVEVGSLIRKPPVSVDAETSIRDAARVMTEAKVSSVMVMQDGTLAGLVTDRDLRTRFVATGLPGSEPVADIMTRDVQTIQKNTLMVQALMTMTRQNIHHLPIMDGERPVGMLNVADLAQQQSTNPAYIVGEIHKAPDAEALASAASRLAGLQLQLVNAGATALHVGEAVSYVTDAITTRLLELGEAKLGPPPVPYAWMAAGSQARREQTSHSDQDNALIISDDMRPEDDVYFAALARFVSDGLDACGFYYCPGDAMATNPQWRQPLEQWRHNFSDWIEHPEPKALMLSSIFFDMRVVRGAEALFTALQRDILSKTRKNRIFIAFSASNALQRRPPLGFFRNFVLIHDGDHDDTFDIKHRGIVPITDLARVHALSEGIAAVNTAERLRAVARTPAVSEEMGENLEDALEFIATLRIRHQAIQIKRGLKADNYLPPTGLSALERDQLKDAFGVIQTMQESLASRYQTARFT
ncbi:MAG: putative nucleotidyltransferase substrate binding domain-containing protein [Pseudomonadota bacterium]